MSVIYLNIHIRTLNSTSVHQALIYVGCYLYTDMIFEIHESDPSISQFCNILKFSRRDSRLWLHGLGLLLPC